MQTNERTVSNLDQARISSLPETAYYIPNFITVEEEERILKKVSSAH